MGDHLIDGEFQSDKYPTTPRGKVPLSVKDPTAQDLLEEYARRRRVVDAEFSDDLIEALRLAGYPASHGEHGRGTHDGGPFDEDCGCRGSANQRACAEAGCGFCLAAEDMAPRFCEAVAQAEKQLRSAVSAGELDCTLSVDAIDQILREARRLDIFTRRVIAARNAMENRLHAVEQSVKPSPAKRTGYAYKSVYAEHRAQMQAPSSTDDMPPPHVSWLFNWNLFFQEHLKFCTKVGFDEIPLVRLVEHLVEETEEVYSAWYDLDMAHHYESARPEDIKLRLAEEIADVMMLCNHLGKVLKLNVLAAGFAKLEKNRQRKWYKWPDGSMRGRPPEAK